MWKKKSREQKLQYKQIWDYLNDRIENEKGVAALMGNLYAESKLNPGVLEYHYHRQLGLDSGQYTRAVDSGEYQDFVTDRAGYGLAQWTLGSRKQGLLNLAKERSASISDTSVQLEYLWSELCENYTQVLEALKKAESIREASDVVLEKLENPMDQSERVKEKRASYALKIYYGYKIGRVI